MAIATEDRVTVLIVEDSEDQLNLLRHHFESAGCEVVGADTAESAIVAFDNTEPDLAVIDLVLPGMSGEELTRLIQAQHPECPIVISSVLDPEHYPVTQGALPKPVNRLAVRDLLRNCVPRWVAP